MKKTAFTLIEMIFVIVILGIVAGMTFIQVSSVYEDMMQKQNSGELESEAKMVLEQITARLSSSIKDSLVAMTGTDGAVCVPVSGPLDKNTKYILAWVGKSDEANLGLWDETLGDYKPGWSGFVDVSGSSMTSIITPGSRLDNAEIIINGLTGLTASLSTNPNSPVALYFNASGSNINACSDFFNNTSGSFKLYRVHRNGTQNTLGLIDTPPQISEQYTLSHSAYAISREGSYLWLYEFRPWLGQNPNANATNRKLLGQNVSGFGFKWSGGLFRINVCVSKKTPSGYDIEVCKEKAIF
jgi:prepilin-type N-terminal cleavage/methylation domain-containing protein